MDDFERKTNLVVKYFLLQRVFFLQNMNDIKQTSPEPGDWEEKGLQIPMTWRKSYFPFLFSVYTRTLHVLQ